MNNLTLMKFVVGSGEQWRARYIKFAQGNTIHVNLRKHDRIDLICNFIHIYQFMVRLLIPYT